MTNDDSHQQLVGNYLTDAGYDVAVVVRNGGDDGGVESPAALCRGD